MSDHLPECPMLDEQYTKHPLEQCDYCDMLRACEQRIMSLNPVALGVLIAQRARERALGAAREAIRNREDGDHFQWVQVEIAIAAIDALQINNSPQQ